MNKTTVAVCRTCGGALSAILDPFESFGKQIRRLDAGFCSPYCQDMGGK